MSFVAVAIGGSALIGGVAGVIGSSKAAKAETQAANTAAQTQRDIFDKQTALQEPFRQGGLTAQNRLFTLLGLTPPSGGGSPDAAGGTDWEAFEKSLDPAAQQDYQANWTGGPGSLGNISLADYGKLYYDNDLDFRRGGHPDASGQLYPGADPNYQGHDLNAFARGGTGSPGGPADPDFGKYARDFSMADFEADPGYAFRMSEGMKALNNSMAARGLGISGANIKGAQRFGQDLASQEYTNAFNRYQVNRNNQLNPLQSIMGAGQSATNTLSNAAQNMGNNVSDLQLQAGNARASGYVGGANAITSAVNGGLNSYFGYRNSSALNSFLNRGAGTFGSGPQAGGSMGFGVDNYNYGMGG